MPNQNVQIIEEGINDFFYKVCLFVTFFALGMVLIEFFSRGQFPSPKIGLFYLGVLLLYSLHKEFIRWIEEKGTLNQQKKGEYIVALWILVTTFLYLLNFFTKDYYRYSPSGQELPALEEISFITLEVLAVFIFTRFLKIGTIYFFQKREEK